MPGFPVRVTVLDKAALPAIKLRLAQAPLLSLDIRPGEYDWPVDSEGRPFHRLRPEGKAWDVAERFDTPEYRTSVKIDWETPVGPYPVPYPSTRKRS